MLKRGKPLSHLRYGRIDGGCKLNARQKTVAAFNSSDDNLDILLVTTGAGGRGSILLVEALLYFST